MGLDDLVLVSVDNHVIEPPGMFRRWLPEKFEDEASPVTTMDDGSEAWEFAGQRILTFGLDAVAGMLIEEYGR